MDVAYYTRPSQMHVGVWDLNDIWLALTSITKRRFIEVESLSSRIQVQKFWDFRWEMIDYASWTPKEEGFVWRLIVVTQTLAPGRDR